MDEGRNHIVLFDGVCNLCNAVVKFIIRHDKKAVFSFASLQSEEGQLLLKQNDLSPDSFDSFIYVENGKIRQKSAAALYLAKRLDGLWPLLYAGIIIPRPLRDFIYKKIADNRYRLMGRSETCMIPTPELKQRFL